MINSFIMSKEFVWILSLIFLTVIYLSVVSIMRSKNEVLNQDIKPGIYEPLNPALDIEFRKQLQSRQ